MAGFNFNHTPKNVPLINTKYRTIKTKIPNPESVAMLERAYELESRSMHGQMPVVWDRADNFQVYDAQGNCWIDFTSTIFVANAGVLCVDTTAKQWYQRRVLSIPSLLFAHISDVAVRLGLLFSGAAVCISPEWSVPKFELMLRLSPALL